MKVLVACEFSSTVRSAFESAGHEAWSCDILPTEGDPRFHTQGDVGEVLGEGWDLMVAHPPCTHLASSGARWFKDKVVEQKMAVDFVRQLLEADIPMIALENPVGVLSTKVRKPDQIIQPWEYGHPESKRTCLWLKRLPPLRPTNVLTPTRHDGRWENQTPSGQNRLGPSADRWKLRSLTYQGIADAMANQWG